MTAPIVYQGIKFPFQSGSRSLPAQSTNEQLIQEGLIQLILTGVGERIMRPDVGCRATSFVFENNDAVLGNLLRAEVQGVVAKYEPRIQLTDIQVSQRSSEVLLTLRYVVLTTGRIGVATVAIPSL